jgi:DNA (cytosine-5)-methyltransferase 1
MNELALFAGAGGGILGGHLLGWRTVCAVEWEPYPASVLCARQNDGFLPPFPVWDDVQTFDGKPWRGIVDVVSGGFPCQDISAAGKGAGIDGERSGMWREMARIIHEVRPKFVFVENSPMLTSRGLGRVLGDLASMGFDARWGVLGANSVGAPHKRDRIWIAGWRDVLSHAEHKWIGRWEQQSQSLEKTANVANPNSVTGRGMESGRSGFNGGEECGHLRRILGVDTGNKQEEKGEILANAMPTGLQGQDNQWGKGHKKWQDTKIWGHASECSWWETEPNVGRVADGVAARVDRLKAIGNGQVSEVARRAWEVLGDL